MGYLSKLSVVIFSFSIIFSCKTATSSNSIQVDVDKNSASNRATTITSVPTSLKDVAWTFEGWGGNPVDLIEGKDFSNITESNWFFRKYKGKANVRSVALHSVSYMEATCKHDVKKQLTPSIIEAAISSVNPTADKESIKKLSEDEVKETDVVKCRGIGESESYSECECIASFKFKGGKKALAEKIK